MLLVGIVQVQQVVLVVVFDFVFVFFVDVLFVFIVLIFIILLQDNVIIFGEVCVFKFDDELLDLYCFKNLVKFGDNCFSCDWSELLLLEQVSMGGGYIMMGVVKGVLVVVKGINKFIGGLDQIQVVVVWLLLEFSVEQQQCVLWFLQEQDVGDIVLVKQVGIFCGFFYW